MGHARQLMGHAPQLLGHTYEARHMRWWRVHRHGVTFRTSHTFFLSQSVPNCSAVLQRSGCHFHFSTYALTLLNALLILCLMYKTFGSLVSGVILVSTALLSGRHVYFFGLRL